MDVWSLSSLVHNRNNMRLLIKSMALSRDANSGIFAIQNPAYKGFQQGTPRVPGMDLSSTCTRIPTVWSSFSVRRNRRPRTSLPS